MKTKEISPLIALSIISHPFALSSVERSEIATPPTSHRKMKYLLMPAPVIKPMGTYVGELQERWQFPSDHLPIGITYGDLHIGSWNVLDTAYMNWVLENSQGLQKSQIVDEHIYIDGKLTLRDIHVADLVSQMLTHPTHPRSILSLQECSRAFIKYLKGKLPENFKIITHHGNAVVIDQNLFDVASSNEIFGVFSETAQRSFQEIILKRKDTGELLRIFNAHLPGDPLGPARFEFAEYIYKTHNPDLQSIAMGDMNFNEIEMADAMLASFERSDFQIFSPYCTNISVAASDNPFTSKAIDHFILFSPKDAKVNAAEDVLIGLNPISQLLTSPN